MTDTETMPRRSGPDGGGEPLVDPALADELLAKADAQGVELLGPDGLLSQVTKAVLERALGEELTAHLGYEKHDPAGRGSGNSRNGSTPKTLLTDVGGIDLEVPRDRAGSFEPKIVRKGQTRLDGFNDRIIALYARGLTTRDIQAHLREMYQVEVSPDLISRVTDAVLDELNAWQARPLDAVYPVVFIDALSVKIRDGVVANRPVYLAIGIDCDGAKQVLGMWIGPSTGESAKFWLSVLSELKSRGVQDVCIVCCDGLTGLPDAIGVIWPQATVQLCVVHLIRASLRYASKKDWTPLCQSLRPIYTAVDEQAAAAELEVFAEKWNVEVPGDRAALARALGGVRAVPSVSPRGEAGDLHNQSHRVDERPAAEGDPQPRPVPHRAVRPQGAVPGGAKPRRVPPADRRHPQLRLETSAASVHDLLRRPATGIMINATGSYTDGLTLPVFQHLLAPRLDSSQGLELVNFSCRALFSIGLPSTGRGLAAH